MADVEMHPEAQAELDATIGWYEQEWEGLGLEFLDEVDRAIARAAQQPNTWRHYTRVPDIHRLNLHRFPYSVIYRYQLKYNVLHYWPDRPGHTSPGHSGATPWVREPPPD